MKISVLTPSYNSNQFIERAIHSVLSQNDPNFEHIIIDGNSSDGTQDILGKYRHLRWISESDSGQSDAMNKAFSLSSGELIVYLNADDWFEPDVFSHVRTIFRTNPECKMLIGNLYIRYHHSNVINLVVPAKDYRKCLLYYRYRFPLNPVSYFYRKEVQETVGKFPEYLHNAMDYWFILRAMSRFSVLETDLVFGTFFQSGHNKTSIPRSENLPWDIVTKHLTEFDPSAKTFFLVVGYTTIISSSFLRG